MLDDARGTFANLLNLLKEQEMRKFKDVVLETRTPDDRAKAGRVIRMVVVEDMSACTSTAMSWEAFSDLVRQHGGTRVNAALDSGDLRSALDRGKKISFRTIGEKEERALLVSM